MRNLVIVGIIFIVCFDAIASYASNRLELPYTWLWPISICIYAVFGYLATNMSKLKISGAIIGALLGLTDTTIGWKISIWLNAFSPDRQVEPNTTATWIVTIIIGTLFASLIGFLGGLLSKSRKSN